MESTRKSKFYCFNNFHYDNELANNIRPSGAQVIIMYIIPPMCIYIEIYISRSIFIFSFKGVAYCFRHLLLHILLYFLHKVCELII